jgi:NAD(P)-dependent dehydrogenase (short-subunit alcohol dehydrogenase family)
MSVIVITGSNSGFGLEAALAFARTGDTVVATMRSPDKADALLSQAEGLDIHVMPLDVSRSDTFSKAVGDIVARHGRIDVLINNAGIHRAGALEDLSDAAFRSVMETNGIGPILLSRAVLPHMRAQESGLIIMISSLSGIAGLPGDLAYAASKYALEGATEALRHEVDRWGIRVALVEAGMYRTSIMDNNFPDDKQLPSDYPADSPYRPLIEWQLKRMHAQLPEAFDPVNVAKLLVEITTSSEQRLRWPADAIATKVLGTLFAQDDGERDQFLRNVAEADWWSRGDPAPVE